MAKVCQLFSGSKGNSIYISSSGGKFLVDAGVSAKRLDTALSQIGVNPDELDGILVTHEHSDHIKGLRVFATKHNIPVFADEKVIENMLVTGNVTDKMTAFPTQENMLINKTEIIPFAQSHDSVACLGYRLNTPDGRSIAVCTDTGYVTDDAKSKTSGCDLIFLEFNHEVTMLQNGSYPYPLKQRILSTKGHLSNFSASEFAKELAVGGTTRFILSHLSAENNTPDIARQTALAALSECGLKEESDFRLKVSPPENNERQISL